ncbi:hypothetical protein, partial [Clostridioides difficile]|uniref:hypothetical protein n=1 Tax=Clostridioides difficile TaxID=1496 RepID=UPI0031B63C78
MYLALDLSLLLLVSAISSFNLSKEVTSKFFDPNKESILLDKLDISLIYVFKDSSLRLVFN